ncbi:HAD-IIB family hydrolase [Mycoplasmopsis gallinarum]
MKDKKTLFIDLDGTLFDKNGISRISSKNLKILRLIKPFANIVFSTGRSFDDIRVKQTLKQTGINDIICCSGSHIFVDSQCIYNNLFDKELLNQIVQWAFARKIIVVLFDEIGELIYTHNWFEYAVIKLLLSKKLKKIRYAKNFNLEKLGNINKIAFIVKNPNQNLTLIKELEKAFPKTINAYAASKNYVIEITDAKSDKGIALKKYCDYKNIDLKNTIHIGDSMADASVKGIANKLVAMGNSTKELKAVADEIAPKAKNGGIYKYFMSKVKKND